MSQTLRSSLLIGLLAATASLAGCGSESSSTGTPGTAGSAGSGGSDAGSGGSDAGSGGSDAGSGGSDAGSGGSDAGSGGSDAGSGGSDAGSGGSDAGSGGSDAGSGGDGGSNGGGISKACQGCIATECGDEFNACVGDDACLACATGDPTTEGCLSNPLLLAAVACACQPTTCAANECNAECKVFGGGQGGSAGAGGDGGSGGSDAGSGGSSAGSGGTAAGSGGSSAGSGGSSAGQGGSSAGSGGSSAGSGGSGGAPLTCADAYSESKCGQCGEKNCCPEMEACLKDTNCLACLQGDDAKCTGPVLDKLNSCLDTKCKDECSGTCNDGGGEYGSGDFACDSCQDKELTTGGCCAAEATKCTNNKACTDLNACLGKCTTQACTEQCAKQFPNGVNDLNALLDCTFGDGTTTAGACGIACGGKSAACTDGGKEYGSGPAACEKCEDTEMANNGCCVYEADACLNNKACVDLNTCLSKCTTQACTEQCAKQFPNGVGHFNDLVDCLYGPDAKSVGACGTVCPN
jgi:hypothetical protein